MRQLVTRCINCPANEDGTCDLAQSRPICGPPVTEDNPTGAPDWCPLRRGPERYWATLLVLQGVGWGPDGG